ncbi:MAG: type I methionyl aminopeptidase [Desulfobacterota bacterium]|nr:type I methionyl aminopeptidase [Thermodesulfobacteriota bacterium]MDW8002395.1 type I methionyl aminopeptidase [Deltaproteobacteria bacterium]
MIVLKTEEEIEKIRTASKYAMEILLYLGEFIKEGIRTKELEKICEEKIKALKKVRAAFKGYNGYPFMLCVSVNEEIVHGMPSDRILKEGDIVSLDFGVIYEGYYGDVAVTYGVGKISKAAQKLIDVTREALFKGIEMAREGNRLYDISHAIQSHVEGNGFSVVKEFVGHGIGRSLHEEPQIPNFGEKGTGPRLKKGMVLAIEPMVNMGRNEISIAENGWTAYAKDMSLSAHFEHTVAITEKGPEILSLV